MKLITDGSHYQAIADAIRAKLSVSTKFRPADMAGAIRRIFHENRHIEVVPLSVRLNGTYRASEYGAYNPVNVSVWSTVSMMSQRFTSNGVYVASASMVDPETGETFFVPAGYSRVTVSVPIAEYSISAFSTSVNGAFAPATGYAFNPITVSVPTYVTSNIYIDDNRTVTAPSGVLYSNVTVSVPGDDNTLIHALVNHTYNQSYSNSEITRVRGGAFYSCSMASVSFPNAEYIGSSAFYDNRIGEVNLPFCSVVGDSAFAYNPISSISLPVCESVGSGAFFNCRYITSVYFPECTYIGYDAFEYCYSLSSVVLPKVISAGSNPFGKRNSLLTQIELPKLETILYSMFYDCSYIVSAIFPSAKSVGTWAFAYCSRMTTVVLDSCEYISNMAFYSCTSLSVISLPNCSFIGNQAFDGCISLMSVYLMGSSVPVLEGNGAFYRTPMSSTSYTGTYGSIYVPASLLSEYAVASYWSYSSLFSRLVGI